MAQTQYRSGNGACTHSHRTVVDAIECARSLHSGFDIVALRNGHAESLDSVEERIRSVAAAQYGKTEREIFYAQWRQLLSRFTDAQREVCYTRWKNSGTIALPLTASLLNFPKPYTNQYRCPQGNSNCGENAVYCDPCNKRYEEFLLIINDDR